MGEILIGAPLGLRVTQVRATENYKLHLTFSNGEKRLFDASKLLNLPVFERLKNVLFFQSVRIAYGSVYWNDDIDYCPDTLYVESIPE